MPNLETILRELARVKSELEQQRAEFERVNDLFSAESELRRRGASDETAIPFDDYAWRVTRTGRLQVRVRSGSAYMVNETPAAYDDALLDVPAVAGDYVVLLRHEYGIGGAEGVWPEVAEVVAVADVPSEMDAGRIVARNFIIATLTVTGDTAETAAISSGPLQAWRCGDVYGYAPYLAPLEGPLVAP